MTKKHKKSLVIGIAAIVVLLLVWLLVSMATRQAQQKKEEKASEEAKAQVILSLKAADIQSLVFDGDEGQIHMEQKDGQWINAGDGYVLTGSRMKLLTDDLAALSAERIISDVKDLTTYGLADSRRTIDITMQDGTAYQLIYGDKNTTTNELYVQLASDPTTVYLTKTALDSHFSGRVQAFAAYDAFPEIEPASMREFDVQKAEHSYILTMTGDDQCSVTGDDGVTQPANLTALGAVQQNLSYIGWVRNMEYDCKDMSVYGLKDPQCVLKVTYGDGDTRQEVTINIGDQDGYGDYYVSLNDSTQVSTVHDEYLSDIVNGQATSFWSLTYSFVSISDLQKLTVTVDGATHTLEYKDGVTAENSTTETADTENSAVTETSSQGEEWLFDGQLVEKELFTKFYYDCVSVTAQERMDSVPADLGDAVMTLTYELKDGSVKEISYYPGDQNFYTVVYENGTKAGSTNKLYVNQMLEDLKKLSE